MSVEVWVFYDPVLMGGIQILNCLNVCLSVHQLFMAWMDFEIILHKCDSEVHTDSVLHIRTRFVG
jgi:hypothetical protein